MKKRLLKILGFAAFAAALSANIARAVDSLGAWNDGGPAPKLILQITVDQLRGDLPGRYLKQMGDGGFRYLMQHSVWYANAHHAHANTETVVTSPAGHAASWLLTFSIFRQTT